MNAFVYAYEEMPDDLATNGHTLIDWEDLPEISRVLNDKFTFYGNYMRRGQNQKQLKEGHFVKALTENGTWQFFEIFKVKKTLMSISVTARFIGAMANKNFIDYSFTSAGNGTRIMNDLQNSLAFKQKFKYSSNVPTVHQFTAKQVKPIDAIIGSNNGNQNLVGVTGGEFDVDNYDLKLVKQIGSDKGYRIDLGINLEAIEAEIDEDSIINSLYLVGGVPETDYNEDKEPIVYKYLEVAGVTDKNRRIGKRENSNITDHTELKEWGQTLFDNDRIHEASATHRVNMVMLEHTIEYREVYADLAKLSFGDVAHVCVPELDLKLQERMVEYVWFPTIQKYKSIVLGNNLSKYTSRVMTETQKLAAKVNNRTESLVQTLLNATAWITGNKGGHVVFRPEKSPSEILIMDNRDVAKAKRVWRWNLNGLGYSDNGVDGPFGIAMTSKGEIVADFIKVGIIQADVFEGSFNELGDQLKLVAGALQAWNNGKKIMEMTKKGMQFWNGTSEIGTIGTTDSAGNPFPDMSTSTPIEGNSLVIRSNEKKFIIISPAKKKGFVMLSGAPTSHYGDFNVQGKMQIYDDVDIKGKLTINGREVYPGQGGSTGPGGQGNGWNGQYPSGITSVSDQFAWQWWVYLIALGFSQAAAAGIMGNINGEAGPSMNPDTDQVGGPAYGGVQMDGSSYPIVGAPTYNGREYVQRIMAAAGITDPYTGTKAQSAMINWCLYNGQWIGRVSPTSANDFKKMTSPEQAAFVFEENFERPLNSHPERQGFARYWYDRFKDLEISQSNSDIVTVAKSLLGYFTYELIHGEAYIGSVQNIDRNGRTDCSGYVWLVLAKAGYRVPGNMQWYTGSMTSDARGAHNWLQEIAPEQSKAGDVIIYNVGGGAGANGHTAILLETYRGNDTQIIQMGGDGRYSGVNISTMGYSFGSLLGGDRCIARAVK